MKDKKETGEKGNEDVSFAPQLSWESAERVNVSQPHINTLIRASFGSGESHEGLFFSLEEHFAGANYSTHQQKCVFSE